MNFPKILLSITIILFGAISIAAWLKDEKKGNEYNEQVVNLELNKTNNSSIGAQKAKKQGGNSSKGLPSADLVSQLFNKGTPKLPIVETITYKSRVSWQKGRAAWVVDYAKHFRTSRHFIARSLNNSLDYYTQNVANGDKFNVYKQDKPFHFHLVVDLSLCKMWLYYVDKELGENVLLKNYNVGLGRLSTEKQSGFLTPLGKYKLGNNVAIYKPKMMGYHQGEKTEMIRVFGSRWIPFEEEVKNCTEPAKGFGIHGCPWAENETGKLVEQRLGLNGYESDGCLRMATEDIEEVFAIIIGRESFIEFVPDFNESELVQLQQQSQSQPAT